MRTLFVAVLMVLRVSGDDMVNVTGYVGESVLLPCPCLDRNESMEFKWQVGEKALLYKSSSFIGSYIGRAAAFLSEDSSNCSIRLNNITAEDQEAYKCIFYKNETYQYVTVNLTVSAENNKVSDRLESPSPISHHHWIIPIVLVLIISLVLYLGIRQRMTMRRRSQSNTREEETDDFMEN